MTQPELIRRRAELVPAFRAAVVTALWEAVEAADPGLLAADDGTPYSPPSAAPDSFGRQSELVRMVETTADKAAEHLRLWL